METALKIVPEVQEVEEKALSVIDRANAIKITDNETYLKAGELWKIIKDMIKEVEDSFNPIVDSAFKAHRKAIEQRDKYLDPLKNAYKGVKNLMSFYEAEQEKIRLAEQRRFEEEARKAEEERRLLEAIEAEQEGDKEVAEQILQEPTFVPPMVLPKATPKIQGGPTYRTVWKFRITNASKVPDQYKNVDEVKVGQVVRALKNQTNIPGIEVYEERC
jgi:hypothetical protein